MAYSTGMLDTKVTIKKRTGGEAGDYGFDSAGVKWADVATVWAGVTWTKGTRALREGVLDAYDVVMIRMRWNSHATRDCRFVIDGKTYATESFHADKRGNTIQVTATEVVNP